MANPQLNKIQLMRVRKLLNLIRIKIIKLSKDDLELIFAFRRKIRKELMYDERGRPTARRKLKAVMRIKQNGFCSVCEKKLPEKYCVLDRSKAINGYKESNVRLICQKCDRKIQERRNFK